MPSIRSRLSRALLAALLGWGLMVVLLVGLVTRQAVDSLLDGTMQESTELLYTLVRPLTLDNEETIHIMPSSPHEEHLVWQVFSSRGHMQARSQMSPAELLAPLGREGFSDKVTSDGTAWRVYSIKADADGSMLHVAQRASDRNQAQMHVAVVTLAAALCVGIATSLWLGRRVRRELEPLVLLSDAVRQHDPLHGPDLPVATREELVPMRDAVMALGRRLSQLVGRERAFTAHAAHILRTPLAGMDAQLAAAMLESPPQGLPRLRRARDALARLNHMVVALLHLFRSDTDLQRQPIDMAALVARWPFEGLAVTVSQHATLRADPDLVTAALLNLLDNAQHYGAGNAVIRVQDSADEVLMQVDDDGPGIDSERLRALQGAIDSGEDSGHLGLGLTLASLVAHAHNGRLRLEALEQGTRVELSFEAERNAATIGRSHDNGHAQ
jgi:signal transduction histidine kinase